MVVIEPQHGGHTFLAQRGIRYLEVAITRGNYRKALPGGLFASDKGFCVNLSVDTSSLDRMKFCREMGCCISTRWWNLGLGSILRRSRMSPAPTMRCVRRCETKTKMRPIRASGLGEADARIGGQGRSHWGTRETWIPENVQGYDTGCQAAIWMELPGAITRVHPWRPTPGLQFGFLVTHNEAIPIFDYFTVGEGTKPKYRPTCHYAYHPSDDAVLSLHECFGADCMQEKHHILDEYETVEGIDELGVLLYGHEKNAQWYGSRPSMEETRELAPYQDATGLQVSSAVLVGMVWAWKIRMRALSKRMRWTTRGALRFSAPIRARSRPLHRLDTTDRPLGPVS